mmetsp:Transcript_4944/g.17869  ORF Transcript_4944/g.17869 Transcript_4944/m.17869 type:complete len:313 (+) Transcript_4944:2198-3136(+)
MAEGRAKAVAPLIRLPAMASSSRFNAASISAARCASMHSRALSRKTSSQSPTATGATSAVSTQRRAPRPTAQARAPSRRSTCMGMPMHIDDSSAAERRHESGVADAAGGFGIRPVALIAVDGQHRRRDPGVAAAGVQPRGRPCAPRAQPIHAERQGVFEREADTLAQAAAVVLEMLGLAADEQHLLRVALHELRQAQHLLESGLVQAHLLGPHEARHFVVLDQLQRAGREPVVDGVEDQQAARALHMLDQVQPLRAAVHQIHVRREVPALLQRFDAAHAEALVGPQQVADAEHDDRRLVDVTGWVTGRFGRA